jgi:hypothetical protein
VPVIKITSALLSYFLPQARYSRLAWFLREQERLDLPSWLF